MPVINGTAGNDILTDQAGDDTIYGLAGDDRINLVNGGYNVVYGGDGDDIVVWNGSGSFSNYGGAGRDTLDASTTSSGYNYTLGSDVEVLLFGSGSDNIAVNDINILTDLTIHAGGGSDDIIAGAGDDILTGGVGSDVLHGNGGDDIYIWNIGDGYDDIRENNGGGTDTIQFGAGIVAGDITVTYGSSDVVIRHVPSGYYLTVRGGNTNRDSVVERLSFAGGVIVDLTLGINLTGTTSSETLYGSQFNDQLNGDAGGDSLRGQAGNDVLTGGAGNDNLYGLEGHDIYVWNLGDGSDYIYENGGGGTDTLRFGSGILASDVTFDYDSYNLYVRHTPSGSVIRVVDGARDAGSTLERLRFADGTTVDLTAGLNYTGTASNNSVYGSLFNDVMRGMEGGDTLRGAAGDDRLEGGLGTDYLYGGAGDDVYVWNIGDGTDYIDEDDFDGFDTIEFGAGVVLADLTFDYSSSNLTINHTPTGGRLVIYGQAQYLTSVVELLRFADDTTYDLRTGITRVGDSAGNTLYGSLFNDSLDGAGGIDTLYGDLGNDVLRGGLGNDYLYGEGGHDTYVWNIGDGDDRIYENGYGGDDTLLFGPGISKNQIQLTYSSSDLTVRHVPSGAQLTFYGAASTPGSALEFIRFDNGALIDITLGIDIAGTPVDDIFYGSTFGDRIFGAGGADTLYGNHGDDTLSGDAGNDDLYGEEGADILQGGGGHDNLYGGVGEDRLQGGNGNDTLDGSDGGDWAWHQGETTAVQINLATQTATGTAIGSDTLISIENAFGSEANDIIDGSAGANVINGAGGNDTVRGGEGNDELLGGAGMDTVEGGAGNDRLFGDEPYTPSQTTTNSGVTSGGEPITISLTGARADPDSFTSVVGYVGARAPTSTNLNIVFVIDVSGSMSSTFQGSETVPDLDGDGYANTLMDGAILGYTALVNNLIETGLGSNRISIVAFDDLASIVYSGPANQDSDADGIPDAIEALRQLRPGGSTYYDLGLQEAIEALQLSPQGDNYVFFESDGAPNGGPYLDEVETLLTTYNATIRALGLGNGASMTALDLVDDGVANNSAERVLTPSTLTAGLLNPDIDPGLIARVEILLNGVVVQTIDGDDLAVTPFGLRFEADLEGLSTTAADTVTARVISTGPNAVTVSTNIRIAQSVLVPGEADTVRGGDGDDFIQGNGGNDILYGDAGNDTLSGGAGNDQVFGGDGQDTVDFSEEFERVVVDLAAQTATGLQIGTDTLNSIEHARGGLGHDRLVARHAAVVDPGLPSGSNLDGGRGDDVLVSNRGADTLIGGDGFDTADFSTATTGVNVNLGAGIIIASGDGEDRLIGIEGLIGSAFADSLTGDAGDNVLDGGAGADALVGGAGFDTADYNRSSAGVTVSLHAGTGLGGDAQGDTLATIERLVGSAFADVLTGSDRAQGDTLDGGVGDDILSGRDGDDTLNGGAGNDQATGGNGADTISGGAGDDILSGGTGDDTLVGQAGTDTLQGGAGIDILQGGTGDDSLNGGDGDDSLNGGEGADAFIGGAGIDTATFAGATVAISVNLATGLGDGGWATGDTFSGIENLYGSNKGDTLIGNDGVNVLNGGVGDDIIDGGIGDDQLLGGSGRDNLTGGAGADTINGGTENDTLNGGAGADVLNGGSENDTLNGGADNDELIGGSGRDTLIGGAGDDTLSGQTGDDTLTGGSGNDLFLFRGAWGVDVIKDFTAGVGSEDVISFSTGDFADFADVLANTVNDGLGNCVISKNGKTIKLEGVLRNQLKSDDFVFVASGATAASGKAVIPEVSPLMADDGLFPLVLPAGMDGKSTADDEMVVCPPGDLAGLSPAGLSGFGVDLSDFGGRDPHRLSAQLADWMI